MWIAGLRGPVAFALALIAPLMSSLFVGTTLIVIFLTTVVLGGLTGVVLNEFATLGIMDEDLNAATPLTLEPKKSRRIGLRNPRKPKSDGGQLILSITGDNQDSIFRQF